MSIPQLLVGKVAGVTGGLTGIGRVSPLSLSFYLPSFTVNTPLTS